MSTSTNRENSDDKNLDSLNNVEELRDLKKLKFTQTPINFPSGKKEVSKENSILINLEKKESEKKLK